MKVSERLPISKLNITRRLPLKTSRPPVNSGLLPDSIHPVVVIPGLLGTWPPTAAPRGRLDPISGTYHNLLDGLTSLGYQPGVSLFSFAYDWRQGVADLSLQLKAEIERIKRLSKLSRPVDSGPEIDYSRVDLLCHSMGGLIGRAYLQSDQYGDDVARLILVAVPQGGTLAAYFGYEGGDSTYIGVPINAARSMISLAQAVEMRLHRRVHRIYRTIRGRDLPDLYEYMQSEMRSIQDLLPLGRRNYLYRLDEQNREQLYPYGTPPGYPENRFLEQLELPEYLDRLDRAAEIICLYSSSLGTLSRLLVGEPGPGHIYPHGQPVAEQPASNRTPGDSVLTVEAGRLDLPPTRSDGQPWQVRVTNQDVAHALGMHIDHVQIVGDPTPVRHILGYFTCEIARPLTASHWDGLLLSKRKPNYRALFI